MADEFFAFTDFDDTPRLVRVSDIESMWLGDPTRVYAEGGVLMRSGARYSFRSPGTATALRAVLTERTHAQTTPAASDA